MQCPVSKLMFWLQNWSSCGWQTELKDLTMWSLSADHTPLILTCRDFTFNLTKITDKPNNGSTQKQMWACYEFNVFSVPSVLFLNEQQNRKIIFSTNTTVGKKGAFIHLVQSRCVSFESAFLGGRCMPGSLIVCQLCSKCSMWWRRWLWARRVQWRRQQFLLKPNYPAMGSAHAEAALIGLFKKKKTNMLWLWSNWEASVSVTFPVGCSVWCVFFWFRQRATFILR